MKIRSAARVLFGAGFIVAGLNHFINRELYIAIVPPYLPWPEALVIISGIAEIVLGALALSVRTARLAGWGLIALLIAVFPANVHMALNPHLYPTIAPVLLWARLPLQAALIAWAYRYVCRGGL